MGAHAFTRIRDAVAALPVHTAVLDGEAVLMRSDNSFDFEGLRSRHGQAKAVLVAGGACRACYPARTRRCAAASNSARRSPETVPPSFVTRAGCGLEGIVSTPY